MVSVGINRREVVNERVIQERNSETILALNHVRAAKQRTHLKRWERVYVGWVSLKLMSSEKAKILAVSAPTVSGYPEGKTGVCVNAIALRASRRREPQSCRETSRDRPERPP